MTEQTRTQKALQTAVGIETEGKAFYLKAGKESTSDLGKKLFTKMANDEDRHKRAFESIYDSIRLKHAWPQKPLDFTRGEKVNSVFSNVNPSAKPAASELDAARTAMEMEQKSINFYRELAKGAADATEKSFYEALTGEEQGHYLALVEYQEYLTDPVDWFTTKEHHSLDGG